jgi:hypothetical protein
MSPHSSVTMAPQIPFTTCTDTLPPNLYVPTLTLGQNLLDRWVIPYLAPDITPVVMVSAPSITTGSEGLLQKLKQSLWVDSGSAIMLSSNAHIQWHQEPSGLAVITGVDHQGKAIQVHPQEVLTIQEKWADVAFTVDVPIVPKTTDPKSHLDASVHNAIWALEHRTKDDLQLFISIPTHTIEVTIQTIQRLQKDGYLTADGDRLFEEQATNEQDDDGDSQKNKGSDSKQFSGVALGGLIRRTKQVQFLTQLVSQVRAIYPGPIHLFGIGQPVLCRTLFEAGATSVDSSSWIRYAVDGALLNTGDSRSRYTIPNPSPIERAHLALVNLAIAQQSTGLMKELPLSLMPHLNTWYLSRLAQRRSL